MSASELQTTDSGQRDPRRPPPPKVVIVGGGLAGLAAAAALADRGLKITLLESRPRLGGRASSFQDPATGELVDNCQHVSMGCCTNLAEFCERVGVRNLFHREPSIVFLSPEGKRSTLRAGRLPAPLHMTGSFLRANYLTFGERLRVAYGLCRLRFARPSRSEPFSSWLARHGQTARTIDRYWATVLVSALNERLDRMDLGHARKVFVDGFLRNKRGYELEIPMAPLGEIYGTCLESWLASKGIDVRLKTGVRSVDFDDDGAVASVSLRSGAALGADFVVLAVPFDRVASLLKPAQHARLPELAGLESMQATPITGIHLWFDRSVCPLDHAVLVGRTIQWVFNHTRIRGRFSRATTPVEDARVASEKPSADAGGEYLQLVVSAAYELVGKSNEEIRDLALADLAAVWPESKQAALARWRVVTEHGATFSVRPGIDALRPPQRTPIDGLFFAGDWTDTGWPATMEGAVRSGYLAAEGILADLGRPESRLVPDLPPGKLARVLLGRGGTPSARARSSFTKARP